MVLSLVPRLHGRMLEKTDKIIKVFIVLLFFVIFLCLLKILSYQEKAFTRYSLLALISLKSCPLHIIRLCLSRLSPRPPLKKKKKTPDRRLGFDRLCSQTVALTSQVAEDRDTSIGEHRYCCVTFEI